MEKKLKIRNLDCAACAAELQELLEKTEGVASAEVNYVAQSVRIVAEDEAACARAIEAIAGFEEVEIVREVEQTIRLKNLDCAACAAELERIIAGKEGVERVSVSFVDQKIVLVASDEGYRNAVQAASSFEEVEVVTGEEEKKKTSLIAEHKKDFICLVIGLACFVPGAVLHFLEGTAAFILSIVFLAACYFVVGHPVIKKFFKSFRSIRGIFDENTLMTIASIGAFCLGEYVEGAAVMLLYQLGEFLQSIAVGSSRRSIVSLMELKSDYATLLLDGEQKTVSPEQLEVGDVILVKSGEKIPADGTVMSGESELDLKSLNGEAVPRPVGKGDEVLSGSINIGGALTVRVTRCYADSTVAKILELVENSASKKAKPEQFITKFARIYTPIVFGIALVVGLVVPGVLALAGQQPVFAEWVVRALKALVISCPCALVISVPLSYFGGIGACARYGILVKGSTYLDTLSQIEVAAFDKTGTLTRGDFSVVGVWGDERTLPIAAAVEALSEHPIAKSLRRETPYVAENAKEIPGKGLCAFIDGKIALVGNAELLHSYRIDFSERESVSTLLYVAYDGQYLGCIAIDDQVKEDAKEALDALKKLGVKETVMLTGDRKERAEIVAKEIGLDRVGAELLPDAKLNAAEELKRRGKLLYVGDGINDAPVMTVSDCAMSMGKLGSDAAIEASDVVLVSDALSSVPKAVRIAKRTRRIVTFNIVFSIAVKLVVLMLGLWDIVSLWLAVFADVGVMLIAVGIAMLSRAKVR